VIYLDFETRSAAELKHVGTYRYARDPSTDVLCACWTWDEDPRVWIWHPGFEDLTPLQVNKKSDRHERRDLPRPPFPEELCERIVLGETIEAHNAFFERNMWTAVMVARYGFPEIDDEQWQCSAAIAASFAMRRKLEHVAMDLRVVEQKDMDGHRLMRKLSTPRKPTKRDPVSPWHQTRRELLRVFRYCAQDVRTERAVSKALRALTGSELAVWRLDQQINLRGIHLDRPLVDKALEIGASAEAEAQVQLRALTHDQVEKTTKRGEFKEWLRGEGVTIPTKLVKEIDDEGTEALVSKETIGADYLRPILKESGLPEHIAKAIELWISVNKTSTKKYRAMANRLNADDRVREILRYWAATTGRWGGMGIQPQNFPRNCPKPREMEQICADLKACDYDDFSMLYGADNVMVLLSRILRGAITAAPGHELVAADYSAIEARGTFWIAGDEDGLEAFRKIDSGAWPDQDIYTWEASKFVGFTVLKSKHEFERQVWGKVPILGCGYQMGPPKLVTYAGNMGIAITDEQAEKIVYGYRSDHWKVKEFWYEVERCAMEAVRRGPGAPAIEMAEGRIKWKVLGGFLHCRLPSGRLLSYFRPALEWDEKFGRAKITFTGYATYKPGLWTRTSTYGGKLTENIVQALSRDIMRDAMLRAEAGGYPIVLTVHDEVVSEIRKGEGDLAEFKALLAQTPEWAQGFPIAVDGWRRERYGK